MRLRANLAAMAEAQRGTLMLWAPVAFGTGIGFYFSLLSEPGSGLIAGLVCLVVGLVFLGRRYHLPLLILVALTVFGIVWATWHTGWRAAPVLDHNYWGPVTGRIVALDRSANNAPRVTLDQVHLPGVDPAHVPDRVRVSLTGWLKPGDLQPGARIMTQVWLGPPSAPVEPGGFDFRRHAWFSGLGAVGYTRDPVMLNALPDVGGIQMRLFRLRMTLSAAIRGAMPSEAGAFAAAILTGDRSAIDPALMQDLRASNLAHLLAISGLHMGLLTGFVFAVLRYGMALIPAVALRVPVKKLAAVAAIFAGLGYLFLSGASVATQRAFIMAAVALCAVLLDRPVLSLRAVAIAAMLVLLIRPVSLTGPGFQMSFAATTALIVGFNALRYRSWWKRMGEGPGRYLRPVLVVTLTSFMAGAATAPISAFHFNTVSQYGLVANVLAVPAMGLFVMPAAVVAGLLAPFGLAEPALVVMGLGIDHILRVAHWVAHLDGALWRVKAGPGTALIGVVLGSCILFLIRGRIRLLGAMPIVAAMLLWIQHPRPVALITENGRMFGLQTEAGRVLSQKRGNGFAARVWLENDGDPGDQIGAAARAGLTRDGDVIRAALTADQDLVWSNSKEPDGTCREGNILVAPKWEETPAGACIFIGSKELFTGGAHAIWAGPNGIELTTVAGLSGHRPWTLHAVRR